VSQHIMHSKVVGEATLMASGFVERASTCCIFIPMVDSRVYDRIFPQSTTPDTSSSAAYGDFM
jgi:hypothetical protein